MALWTVRSRPPQGGGSPHRAPWPGAEGESEISTPQVQLFLNGCVSVKPREKHLVLVPLAPPGGRAHSAARPVLLPGRLEAADLSGGAPSVPFSW